MKTYLVSYSTPEWAGSQHILALSAKVLGIDNVLPFTRAHLVKTRFYRENQELLDAPVGAGYWLWKPYFMLETMRNMQDGDMLIYLDSGFQISTDMSPLFSLCLEQDGILLFTNGYLNSSWTKRDCFALMGCDKKAYYPVEQTVGGSHLWIKQRRSVEILEEWLEYCKNKHIISDLPNTCGLDNLPGFRLHRHDQSILTNLSVKHGIERFRDPSEYGNSRKMDHLKVPGERVIQVKNKQLNCSQSVMENSHYGTILNLHRQAYPLSSVDLSSGEITGPGSQERR